MHSLTKYSKLISSRSNLTIMERCWSHSLVFNYDQVIVSLHALDFMVQCFAILARELLAEYLSKQVIPNAIVFWAFPYNVIVCGKDFACNWSSFSTVTSEGGGWRRGGEGRGKGEGEVVFLTHLRYSDFSKALQHHSRNGCKVLISIYSRVHASESDWSQFSSAFWNDVARTLKTEFVNVVSLMLLQNTCSHIPLPSLHAVVVRNQLSAIIIIMCQVLNIRAYRVMRLDYECPLIVIDSTYLEFPTAPLVTVLWVNLDNYIIASWVTLSPTNIIILYARVKSCS